MVFWSGPALGSLDDWLDTMVKKNFFIKHYTKSQSPFDNKPLNVYKTDHDLITVSIVTQEEGFYLGATVQNKGPSGTIKHHNNTQVNPQDFS